MEIGAQLFTVHDFCKDLDSFAESLKKVADIGYKYIQVSGTCEYEPQWLKEQLDKTGLKCVLTHNPAPKFRENAAQLVKDHDIFDCKYIGLGYYPFTNTHPFHTFESFFEIYPKVSAELAENGKYFMYHNHANEFQRVDGKLIMEHIAEKIPAEHLGFTLDTFWVQAGGCDPAEWIEKLSGRVPVVHLKDYIYGDVGEGKIDKKMAAVGEGNLNFDKIFKAAEKAGTEYMLVEQDDCYGEDPFDCLTRSYNYLKACGFK